MKAPLPTNRKLLIVPSYVLLIHFDGYYTALEAWYAKQDREAYRSSRWWPSKSVSCQIVLNNSHSVSVRVLFLVCIVQIRPWMADVVVLTECFIIAQLMETTSILQLMEYI